MVVSIVPFLAASRSSSRGQRNYDVTSTENALWEAREMALAAMHKRTYARLRTRVLRQIVTTEAEKQRMIAGLEKVDTRARPLTRKRNAWHC